MNLTCDLCGNTLTEINENQAICNHCGLEYGPDRLQELRGAMPPVDPVPPQPPKPHIDPVPPAPPKPPVNPQPTPPVNPQPKQQEKSGCGVWFWIIVAILDLVVGTHGIVAVFCLIIAWLVSRSSKKK